jgi:putative ABC transport system permease protein
VIIVGPRLLDKLAITGSPIGRLVQTPALTLEIVGVLEEQGATLGNDPTATRSSP